MSGDELTDAVTRLTASLDGLPVEMRQVVAILAAAKDVPSRQHWHPILTIILAISLLGNVASPLMLRASNERAGQVVDKANQALIKASDLEATTRADAETNRRLELHCLQVDIAVVLAGAKAETQCNP